MNKEKDFFKTCFNIVASLEVTNQEQAIAKEVVLSEVENLQQKNQNLEQALDEIEKICNSIPKEDSICDIGEIHDIEVIIQKLIGDVKNEI